MKIVLFALNASYQHTNLAIRSLRRSLESCGFSCVLIEKNLKDRRRAMLEALVRENADMIGFSVYIWNREEMLRLAEEIKTVRPGTKVFFGGPEVSFEDGTFFEKYPFVDHLIRGEGETAVVSLVSDPANAPRLIDGIPDPDFGTQTGICYKEGEEIKGSLFYYESSRGCPFRCGYCLSSLSGRVRMKSAEQTLVDLLAFETLGAEISVVKFIDRTFNCDPGRAKEIWRGLLSEKYTKKYHFEICASLLDEESFDILSRFPKGKVQVEIGIQSANPEPLRAVRRDPDVQTALQKTAQLKALGNIHVHADLIAGLPGESYDSFARSYDALWGKCDMLQLGFLKLLRGSYLRENASRLGIAFSPAPPYEVLSTPVLSFEELSRLHRIDDVSERYSSFSSVHALVSSLPSPFRFFEGLADSLGEGGIRSLSQIAAYEALFSYVSSLPIGEDGKNRFVSSLILDFLRSETGKLPLSLRPYVIIEDKQACTRKDLPEDFSPASTVRVTFPQTGQTYFVDRRSGRAEKAFS